MPYRERRVDQYPHEFSGGMRQRAMIAMAIANDPAVLDRRRADDRSRRDDPGPDRRGAEGGCRMSAWPILLITHDLGLIAELADRVVVMYAGTRRRARRRLRDLQTRRAIRTRSAS